MARYEVVMQDGTVEVIDGVDSYQQEGQMTTFFTTASTERRVLDSWSTRVASIRTSELVAIRRRGAICTA